MILQRYFIKLAYNGTNYHGWQLQENSHTVQAELNHALSTVFCEKVETTGCGRTDTGVHAKEYYAHFDSERIDLDDKDLLFKINKFLPKDIGLGKIFKVNEAAHARFDAISRTYHYYISRVKDPFMHGSSYYLYGQLDLDLMNKATRLLFEYTDFSCFSKSRTQVKTNDCTIKEATWEDKGDVLIFKISANRFLRNMVRAIVGTLIETGRKQISLEDFKNIIENKNRSGAGFSVPAEGLFLTKIDYPEGLIQ